MKSIVFSILSFLSIWTISAQNPNVVEYTKEFDFKEGLYPDFKSFRENSPILKSRIVSDMNRDDIDFIPQLLEQKKIDYLDSAGNRQSVNPDKLWGYSKNNGVFINYKGSFNRISVVGSLCHFTATIVQYVYMGGPTMMGTTMVPTKELRQFVLDMDSGKILEFTVENMEYLLQADNALFTQFEALKKREKRDAVFVYLRQYNQKHPLYFPAN